MTTLTLDHQTTTTHSHQAPEVRPGHTLTGPPCPTGFTIATIAPSNSGTLTLTGLQDADNTLTTLTLTPADLTNCVITQPRPQSTLSRLTRLLEDQRNQHRHRIDTITTHAHQWADDSDWCAEFDDILDDLGLPAREHDYTAEISVTLHLCIPVTARDSDSASEQITTSMVSDALHEHDLDIEPGDWDLDSIERD